MTNNAPEKIFLQDDGDYAGAQAALSDLTWCVDQINENDTEYIRLDLYTAVCAERDDQKKARLEAVRCWIEAEGDVMRLREALIRIREITCAALQEKPHD